MFKQPTYTLAKDRIYQTALAKDIKANRLSSLLDLQTSGEPINNQDPLMVYEIMMQPHNISFMTTLLSEGSLLFNTVLSGKKDYALYNEEGTMSKLKPVDIEVLRDWFMALIGSESLDAFNYYLDWSADAFYTWLCLLDTIRRNHLEQMVLHLMGKPIINEEALIEELELAKENKDLRWLTPFFLETHGYDKEVHFKAGLMELMTHNLIKIDKGEIILTDQGETQEALWQSFKVVSGIQSYFYDKGGLTFMASVFIRLSDSIMYLELSDRIHMKSIDSSQVEALLAMIIAPGEAPDIIEQAVKEPSKVVEVQEEQEVEGEWQCECGTVNKNAFCRMCGTKRPVADHPSEPESQHKFCMNCGSPRSPKAKFCKHCGHPF